MGEFPILGFGAHMLRLFLLIDNLILFAAAVVELVGVTYYANIFDLVNTWFVPCVVLGSLLLVISLIAIIGIVGNNRCLLWLNVIINILLGLVLLIICSYALSAANDGAAFVANAWKHSPDSILARMQITFDCCGLESFNDGYAVLPCPGTAGVRCIDPLLEEFNNYSSQLPIVGLITWAVLWLLALMTYQLTRLIKHAKRPEEF